MPRKQNIKDRLSPTTVYILPDLMGALKKETMLHESLLVQTHLVPVLSGSPDTLHPLA